MSNNRPNNSARKTYYKVMRPNLTSVNGLSSVQYYKGEWVTAPGKSRLFLFDSLKAAKRFASIQTDRFNQQRELVIHECAAETVAPLQFRARVGFDSFDFEYFWWKMESTNLKSFYSPFQTPFGTVGAKAVKVGRCVKKYLAPKE